MTQLLNVYPFALIISAIVAVAVAGYIHMRFRAPGVRPFTWLMLAIAQRALFSGLEIQSTSPEEAMLFAKLSFIGITAIPPIWVLFVLEYTQEEVWFPRILKRVMWVMPAMTLGLVFTNEHHELIWQNPQLIATSTGAALDFTFGPWFWLYGIYSYALTLGGILILGAAILQFSPAYRRQGLLLFIGTLFPWVTNVLYVAGVTGLIDLTPLVIIVSGGLFALAFIRFNLFTIRPIARGNLMGNISDGIMILDAGNQIADINQTALNMLELENNIIGRPVSGVFNK